MKTGMKYICARSTNLASIREYIVILLHFSHDSEKKYLDSYNYKFYETL